jgi:hypothetical protein
MWTELQLVPIRKFGSWAESVALKWHILTGLFAFIIWIVRFTSESTFGGSLSGVGGKFGACAELSD